MSSRILVHGGVGQAPAEELPVRLDGLREAVAAAADVLAHGGKALDAAVRAVVVMEDAPLLNAGYDCCLNLEGEAEHDASIMDSSGLGAGVGAVQGLHNPILLARAVAERTEHRLMVGRGAERLARMLGLSFGDSVTPRAQQRYGELIGRLRRASRGGASQSVEGLPWKKLRDFLDSYELHSTVGAVVRDRQGGLAAATSTGGMWLKLPGRVGDSALLGAGTYCSVLGAASCTGMGEGILRLGVARKAVERLAEPGLEVRQVAREILEEASVAGVDCGMILLAADGQFAVEHNCRIMPRAFLRPDGSIEALF